MIWGAYIVIPEYVVNIYTLEGPSMEPTVVDGSMTRVLIERWSHRLFGLEENTDVDGNNKQDDTTTTDRNDLFAGIWKQHFTSGVARGDVVILNHPSRDGTICKRVIGIPGDTIVRTDGGSEETNHRERVPTGHLWIEGDNSRASHDSRAYGAIPAALLIGKVICRLWPLREYVSLGVDANGIEHWKSMSARIGRGDRPLPDNEHEEYMGSHVLGLRRRDGR